MENASYFLIMAITAAIVIYLAVKTCMLQDIVVNKVNFHAIAIAEKIQNPIAPFSLARTQMAFWTVIIFSSFVFVWIKNDFGVPTVSNPNLILLGIAVSTTASAKLIDDSQKGLRIRIQDDPSRNFLSDILSDSNGVSIHRLQNVLWTIVVGIIYISFVATEHKLPDEKVLTDQLLWLMGISTTAYVGIKTMENSKA